MKSLFLANMIFRIWTKQQSFALKLITVTSSPWTALLILRAMQVFASMYILPFVQLSLSRLHDDMTVDQRAALDGFCLSTYPWWI